MIQTRLSVLAALTGLLAPGAVAQADADLVLLNGRIAVGDGPYIQVEAATVRDGRFVFLGSSAEAHGVIGRPPPLTVGDVRLLRIRASMINNGKSSETAREAREVVSQTNAQVGDARNNPQISQMPTPRSVPNETACPRILS